MWLEDGALQQSMVMGEGLGLFRKPDPCASLSPTWHVSQVAKRGTDLRFTLQEMEPLGHFGAVLSTPESKCPYSINRSMMDKRGVQAPGLGDLAPGTEGGGPGGSYQLTGVASCSPVNCALAQAGSPST